MSVKQGLQLLFSASANVWLLCFPFACVLQHLIVVPSTVRVRELLKWYCNEFAAGFMGNYNILDSGFAKNWLNLEVPYKVAIRPESIFIDEKPNGVRCANDMPLRGTIKFTQLLGNVIRYTVESDGKDLTVDLLNSAAVKPIKEGQVVNLFFNADEINVIGA